MGVYSFLVLTSVCRSGHPAGGARQGVPGKGRPTGEFACLAYSPYVPLPCAFQRYNDGAGIVMVSEGTEHYLRAEAEKVHIPE